VKVSMNYKYILEKDFFKMRQHRFKKSISYNTRKGCPPGFHKRTSYTVKSTGKFVPPRCVRSTTTYNESRKEFTQRLSRRASQRLARSPAAQEAMAEGEISCPPGMVPRKGYVRHFRNTVKREGYEQMRRGKIIKVKPSARDIYVKPGCIKERGIPDLPESRKQIGPLREGELKKHGYSSMLPKEERHDALTKAMKEFGALGVFRKLDAVAKLSEHTQPKTSRKFAEDRDWLRDHYILKAFDY
jgi:Family of unknown function (DUF5771)